MPQETIFILDADRDAAQRIAKLMAAGPSRRIHPSYTAVLSIATAEGMQVLKAAWEKPAQPVKA